jgi:hypothetical protein
VVWRVRDANGDWNKDPVPPEKINTLKATFDKVAAGIKEDFANANKYIKDANAAIKELYEKLANDK